MEFSNGYAYGSQHILMFIDESGDPCLRDPGNRTFVFGCSLVRGMDYEPHLKGTWLALRQEVLGDSTKPIHMKDISNRLGPARKEALEAYFNRSAFMRRLAISFESSSPEFKITSRTSELVLRPSFDELLYQMAQMISDTRAEGVVVIFENSIYLERLAELNKKLEMFEDSKPVPVQFCKLPKGVEIGLESADVIAHTMARSIRRRGRGTIPPPFTMRFSTHHAKQRLFLDIWQANSLCVLLPSAGDLGS